ncbi:hypothetical protein [Pseudoxanthomonas composti]|uniref:hypothetical protein n=1 Tax=Pseudoxanthomonas composti TaxID=2137479 RepID=UPI0013E951A0|nr:hypothetical protein [Pseudoxanthomonas composti]
MNWITVMSKIVEHHERSHQEQSLSGKNGEDSRRKRSDDRDHDRRAQHIRQRPTS